MNIYTLPNTLILPPRLHSEFLLREFTTDLKSKENPTLDINFNAKFDVCLKEKRVTDVYLKTLESHTELISEPIIVIDPINLWHGEEVNFSVAIKEQYLSVAVKYNKLCIVLPANHPRAGVDKIGLRVANKYTGLTEFNLVKTTVSTLITEPIVRVPPSLKPFFYRSKCLLFT